ncbi:hypothetical protein VTK56DRAFT_5492 [Thermocarpiscus australiensis]
MIRPRGPPSPAGDGDADHPTTDQPQQQQNDLQDFIYTPDEFAAMKASIAEFKSSDLLLSASNHGDDGFVFGILRRDGRTGELELDVQRNRELVELARPYRCVLHRAVDDLLISRPDQDTDQGGERAEVVIKQVRECGFDGVLTSGGPGRAVENVAVLRGFIGASAGGGGGGRGVEVIVGGGVRKGNLRELMEALGSDAGRVWFHSSCFGVGRDGFDGEEARGLVEEIRALGGSISRD